MGTHTASKEDAMRRKRTVTLDLDQDLYQKISLLASANNLKVKHYMRKCLAQSAAAPPTIDMLNNPSEVKDSVDMLLSAFEECAVLGNIKRWAEYQGLDNYEFQNCLDTLCRWTERPLIHI